MSVRANDPMLQCASDARGGSLAAGPAASSLYDLLLAQAQRDADAPAILAPGRVPLSFGALLLQIDAIQAALGACGLGRGDRVALLAGRGPETAVAVLGLASCATCVPLNESASLPEIEQLLMRTAAKAILVPANAPTEVKDLAHRTGIGLLRYLVTPGAAAGRFHIVGGRAGREDHAAASARRRPATSGDIALILCTSGTTAQSKIVPISHANIIARADNARRVSSLDAADRCLNLRPLFYYAGVAYLIFPLAAGGAVICPPALDAEAFLVCMREFFPTWYTTSPAHQQAILTLLEQRPNALSGHRLRFVRTGGAPMPARVRADSEQLLGVRLLDNYSSTESGSIALTPLVAPHRPGTIGIRAHDDIGVLDTDGSLLPPGKAGELVVRGPMVFAGYLDDPATNQRVICGEWYRTGDHGVIDADGYVSLLGRIDDMINRGGEKIAPREVDRALLAHEAVEEAISFPVPHPTLHQEIAAAVVLRSGTQTTGLDLRRFLADRLTPFKVPRVILCVPEIPKGATGKISRKDLAVHFGVGPDAAPTTRADDRLIAAGMRAEPAEIQNSDTTPGCRLSGDERTQAKDRPAANLYDLLLAHAQRDADAPAILAPGRVPLSFGALLQQIDAIQAILDDCGIGRSDRVALLAGRGPETAVAAVSLASCAACVPVHDAVPPAEIELLLIRTRAKALLTPASAPAAVKDLARRIGIALLQYTVEPGAAAGRFSVAISAGAGNIAAASARGGQATAGDIALILRTSGTTAQAKLIPISHGNIVARANNARGLLRVGPDDVCLDLRPLGYQAGLSHLIFSLTAGSAVICPPDFDEATFLVCMQQFRPTWYTPSPALQKAILTMLEERPDALAGHRLRFVRMGGAPLSERVRMDSERLVGVRVLDTYSSTESGLLASTPLVEPHRPDTIGIRAHDEIGVMGADGNLLPPGVAGELVARGSMVFAGYLDDPAATQRAFRGEWYRTSDHGALDADGYVRIHGRIDDLINRGGEKIVPREVDDALLAHEAVAEAVSFPVPHPTLHQEIAAAVVLRTGAPVTGLDLRRYLAARLAAFKIPRVILCVSELPHGPTGKVGRKNLAAHFGLGLDAAPAAAIGAGSVTLRASPSSESAPVAPLTETQQALLAMWREILRREDTGVDDDFFLCGGDSLSAVDLLHRIEETLQFQLPLNLLIEAPTVRQLDERIQTGTLGPIDNTIGIHTAGSQRPLFAVGGVHGTCLYLSPVLRALGPDQPCYGLQPPGLDWSGIGCTTLPEMATHYIGRVRSIQPQGPYRLLGDSFGGNMVYEIALQLQRMGEEIEFLGLLDTNPLTVLSDDGVNVAHFSALALPPPRNAVEAANQRLHRTQWQASRGYVLDGRSGQDLFNGVLTYFYCTGEPVIAGNDRRRLWQRFARDGFRLLPRPGVHNWPGRGPQYAAVPPLLSACLNGGPLPAIDPAALFDLIFRIENRSHGESIRSSSGAEYAVDRTAVLGCVDTFTNDATMTRVAGWAIEPDQRPARTIAIFFGDRFHGYGSTGAPAPAAVREDAGFDFRFNDAVADGAMERPRLFVLLDNGRAAELPWGVAQEAAALRTRVTDLQARCDELADQLRAMEISTCWRITAPLRHLRDGLARWFGR